MAGYGWEEYDVRTGGKQVIHDRGNHIDLTTEFVKVEGGDSGTGSEGPERHLLKLTVGLGGNWGVRIKGALREDGNPTNIWCQLSES